MEEKSNLTAERSLEPTHHQQKLGNSTHLVGSLRCSVLAIYRISVEESWRAGVEYALGHTMAGRICRQLAH